MRIVRADPIIRVGAGLLQMAAAEMQHAQTTGQPAFVRWEPPLLTFVPTDDTPVVYREIVYETPPDTFMFCRCS
jgi:hypothetical protein